MSHSKFLQFFMPKRRPMDNVEWDMRSPQEDEFALCNLTFKSPCMGWVLLKKRDHYDRYLTFRDVPRAQIDQWQESLLWLLKKLTFKHGRPLVLKSPPHTGRIRLLLEMFPTAKFVHIHRNPYTVFQSSRKTFLVNYTWHRLQRAPLDDLDDRLIEQYRRMYDAFFEERGLIPNGNFHEVAFEELESDPMGQMQKLYESLGLPDFRECEGALRRYVDSLVGYKKNKFSNLPVELRGRIAERWKPCFDEWGYPQ